MKNVKHEVKDGKLLIEVDLSQNFGLSKSGKTQIVASTQGNVQIAEAGVTVGLNIYKPRES